MQIEADSTVNLEWQSHTNVCYMEFYMAEWWTEQFTSNVARVVEKHYIFDKGYRISLAIWAQTYFTPITYFPNVINYNFKRIAKICISKLKIILLLQVLTGKAVYLCCLVWYIQITQWICSLQLIFVLLIMPISWSCSLLCDEASFFYKLILALILKTTLY